jgi:DNA-binding transcriptional LysR family regulator
LIGFEGPIENITPARWLRAMAPDCEIACRSNSVLGLLFAIQSGFGLGLLPCQIGDAEEDIVRVIDPQPGLIGGFWRPKNPGILRFHAGGDRQVSTSSARPDTTIAWQSGAI